MGLRRAALRVFAFLSFLWAETPDPHPEPLWTCLCQPCLTPLPGVVSSPLLSLHFSLDSSCHLFILSLPLKNAVTFFYFVLGTGHRARDISELPSRSVFQSVESAFHFDASWASTGGRDLI